MRQLADGHYDDIYEKHKTVSEKEILPIPREIKIDAK